jgi:seryl-tRNA synthetase
LKEAISTIKDLKWTIEGNEDIYEDLKEELKGNLLKLVILIEENVKKTREDSGNLINSSGTE